MHQETIPVRNMISLGIEGPLYQPSKCWVKDSRIPDEGGFHVASTALECQFNECQLPHMDDIAIIAFHYLLCRKVRMSASNPEDISCRIKNYLGHINRCYQPYNTRSSLQCRISVGHSASWASGACSHNTAPPPMAHVYRTNESALPACPNHGWAPG